MILLNYFWGSIRVLAMWLPGITLDWLFTIFELFALLFLIWRGAEISCKVGLIIWISSNILMQLITPQITLWCHQFIEHSYTIWYGSWITFNLASLWLLAVMHRILNVRATTLSKFISASFLALTVIQLAGYTDRAIFGTKLMDEIYRFMIISINLALIPATIQSMRKTYLGHGVV